MTISLEKVCKRLKERGFRLTQIRKNLIHFILNRTGHWNIQEIIAEASQKIPSVGSATIYRTVHLLSELEFLTETHFGTSSSRYEIAPRHHHDHLTCLSCGEIFEFENDTIEELQEKVAKKLGFQLSDHRMELYGECQKISCKGKRKKAS